MTPGERQAITECARGAITWARELAGRCAEARTKAAELRVIADDICSQARAERERAGLLARERDRTAPVVVRWGAGGTPQSRTRLSSSQTQIQIQTDAAIRQPIRICVSAAAVPAAAVPGVPQVRRRV